MNAEKLSPEIMNADKRIQEFDKKYGNNYLSLACYAAFPLVLTSDLLYQIWAKFVPEASWISVSHLLLSPLCEEVGDEMFEMDLNTRNLLLKKLKEGKKGKEQLENLAYFMQSYVKQRLKGEDEHTRNLRQREEWTALFYINPCQAARDLAYKLSQCQKAENIREAFRWTTFTKTVATPLIEAGFEPLLTYNDIIINAAYGKTNTEEYRQSTQKWEQEKSEVTEKLNLNFPIELPFSQDIPESLTQKLGTNQHLNTLLEKLNINLRNFNVEVATIEVRSEESEIESEIAEDLSIKMIYIPGGTFWMGTEDEEIERLCKKFNWEGFRREKPQHQVTVSPFYMSQTPITQAQWKAIALTPKIDIELEPEPSRFKDDPPQPPFERGENSEYPQSSLETGENSEYSQPSLGSIENSEYLQSSLETGENSEYLQSSLENRGENISSPPFKGGARGGLKPVERVSWNQAVEFCKRLSRETGKEYRLPSEAEWEYACRGISDSLPSKGGARGGSKPFHFGETLTGKLANYCATVSYAEEAKGEYRQKTTPVGQFLPNGFGLYDMHGNVWEWCQDDYHNNYEGAPDNGTAWIDNDNHSQNKNSTKILRGGAWSDNPHNCRSAYRNNLNFDNGLNNIGFRVAVSFSRIP